MKLQLTSQVSTTKSLLELETLAALAMNRSDAVNAQLNEINDEFLIK